MNSALNYTPFLSHCLNLNSLIPTHLIPTLMSPPVSQIDLPRSPPWSHVSSPPSVFLLSPSSTLQHNGIHLLYNFSYLPPSLHPRASIHSSPSPSNMLPVFGSSYLYTTSVPSTFVVLPFRISALRFPTTPSCMSYSMMILVVFPSGIVCTTLGYTPIHYNTILLLPTC